MWSVVFTGDDITKIVAAVGVILTIILQAWNNRQQKKNYAETKLQLQGHGNQLARLNRGIGMLPVPKGTFPPACSNLPEQIIGPNLGPNLNQLGPHF